MPDAAASAPQTHAVELTLGGARGEPLSVRVAEVPPWLRVQVPGAAVPPAGEEAVTRFAFSGAPDALLGEVAAVELIVADAGGEARAERFTVVR